MSPRRAARSFEASEPARKIAVCVLEVMAGIKTALEASKDLGVSANQYYVYETRAIGAMVKALEPRARGPKVRPEAELERLRRELKAARSDMMRYQSLWRTSQRAIGLSPAKDPAPSKDKKGGKGVPAGKVRRVRRRSARVTRTIAALSGASPAGEPTVAAVEGGGA